VFGLFWLLGFQFSPRLADIDGTRFWRIDPKANYGVLNYIARHPVNTDRIRRNWDDRLKVAGSLKMGTVSASELMRSLLNTERPSMLARYRGLRPHSQNAPPAAPDRRRRVPSKYSNPA
jgi:TnpA family transposase